MCACPCHGKKGVAATYTDPHDQCTVCAQKHIDKAHGLFCEFNYKEANRREIHTQLRLAVDHLMFDHYDLAVKARDLAVIIQMARDAEITTEWDDLLNGVDDAFFADHPEVKQRLEILRGKAATAAAADPTD